jgi:hypothetical protein
VIRCEYHSIGQIVSLAVANRRIGAFVNQNARTATCRPSALPLPRRSICCCRASGVRLNTPLRPNFYLSHCNQRISIGSKRLRINAEATRLGPPRRGDGDRGPSPYPPQGVESHHARPRLCWHGVYAPKATVASFDKPFPVDGLSPESFERFSQSALEYLFPEATVHAVGGQGHTQEGADIDVTFPDGTCRTFQCKRVAQFGPRDVDTAVAEHTYDTQRPAICANSELATELTSASQPSGNFASADVRGALTRGCISTSKRIA